jgi:hypothetical protein
MLKRMRLGAEKSPLDVRWLSFFVQANLPMHLHLAPFVSRAHMKALNDAFFAKNIRYKGALFVFVASFCLGAIRVFLPESGGYYRLNDEDKYYMPEIRRIYEKWPGLDLKKDSLSATAPGYAFAMATVSEIIGLGSIRLHLVQLLMSALIPSILYIYLRKRCSVVSASLVLAPLLLSSFFIKSSAYLVTDNAALLCTVGALYLLTSSCSSLIVFIGLAAINTAAVFLRQNSLWLVLPALVGAGAAIIKLREDRTLFGGGGSLVAGIAMAAAVVLPIGAVARMYVVWGGLVPPEWSTTHEGGWGLAPLAYILSVIGLFWPPFLLARKGLKELVRAGLDRKGMIVLSIGLLVAIASDTSYNRDLGRWGGYLWALADALPAPGNRSVVFLLLSPFGALSMWIIGEDLCKKDRIATIILGSALAGWSMACLANREIYHRYYEPYLLVFAIFSAGVYGMRSTEGITLRRLLPLIGLGVFQGTVTVLTLYLSLFAGFRR